MNKAKKNTEADNMVSNITWERTYPWIICAICAMALIVNIVQVKYVVIVTVS